MKKLPDKNVMREFFWLYEIRDKKNLWRYDALIKQTGNADMVTEKFLSSVPVYNSFDEMLCDFGLQAEEHRVTNTTKTPHHLV